MDNPGEIFSEIEAELRQTIIDNGGSISHHHGVGKLRAEFMDQVYSDGTIELLKDLKRSIDPDNVFGIANNVMVSEETKN